jgi:hypothetical protein
MKNDNLFMMARGNKILGELPVEEKGKNFQLSKLILIQICT